jgi:hypothetical protein
MALFVAVMLGGLALSLASARRRLHSRLGDPLPQRRGQGRTRPVVRPTPPQAVKPSRQYGPFEPFGPGGPYGDGADVLGSASSSRAGGIPVQLLFATPSDLEDVLVLDCIVGTDGALAGVGPTLRRGTPFTVKADLTCTADWATLMIESLLDRWTDKGTPVQMVILDGSSGREVRLFDHDSRVQLPLAA